MKTNAQLLATTRRCIKSAAETFDFRTTASNLNALEDIESDLESGLKAVKELIERNLQDRIL